VPVYKRQIQKEPGKYHPFKTTPFLGTCFLRLNVTQPPLNDKRVRKALALTIDRDFIVSAVTIAGERPASSFTPPNTAGYKGPGTLNPRVKPENVDKARRLLAEAGYPSGKRFGSLVLHFDNTGNNVKLAEALSEMWRNHLGINVSLRGEDWTNYHASQHDMTYQISRSVWIADYPDPNAFLSLFVTGGSSNKTGWGSMQYDALIKQAARTESPDARYEILRKSEEILLDELPILPIYTYTHKKLVSERLRLVLGDGRMVPWQSNILGTLYLKHYAIAP